MDIVLPNRLAAIIYMAEAFVFVGVKELCSCLFCLSLAVRTSKLQYPLIQARDLIGRCIGGTRLENSANLGQDFVLVYELTRDTK